MKVIDNFLNNKDFEYIRDQIISLKFPWYYNDNSNYAHDGIAQLTYSFYFWDNPTRVNGNIQLLKPILDKLNVKGLIRIKANLNFPSSDKKPIYHTDSPFEETKTAVYYLNSNNGGTQFKNKFVESKENRMVIFNTQTKHSAIPHDNNKQARFVINFNYYEE